jgi:hypothetical protein
MAVLRWGIAKYPVHLDFQGGRVVFDATQTEPKIAGNPGA